MAADSAAAPTSQKPSITQQMAIDSAAASPNAPTSPTATTPTTTADRRAAYERDFIQPQVSNPGAFDDGAFSSVGRLALHGITGGLSYLGGLARGAGALAAGGGLADAANEIEQTHDQYTYQPPAGSGAARILDAAKSKYSPLTWLGNATGALGDKTLAATDSPALATLMDVGTNAAVSAGVGKMLGGAGRALSRDGAPATAPAATPQRIEPTMASVENNPTPPLSDVAAGVPSPPLRLAEQQPVPPKSAPFANGATAAPKPTFSDPAHGVFAESAPDVKGGLSDADQERRAAILQEIGLDQVRRSAITGDANQAAVDFQTSRLKGSPGGDAMSAQLANEKQTIANYADSIAQKTGGSALNDQSAKLARGEAILTPLEGLKEWFDNQTSALYQEADQRAQGVPTQLDNFRSVLGDDSLATNSDRVNLRTAAAAYAKKLGIVDDQGNVFANAQQAETMRKYLNENWSPQNSGLVGKLKDALDTDVMQAAGEDVYGQARALRAQRAQTLNNPNGIAKLLDSSGPQGVNRAVPVEKVADTVTNMPVAQLQNIVGTLRNMPPELQPMAQDALAEIKAQYAHNVKDIGANQQGQWNAKGVQKYLSNNSARMASVFSPEEMDSFGTLNDAGNILAKDQSYPGAAAQHQNLVRAGVMHGIAAGTTAAGSAIGGPIGGVVGGALGGKLANKFNDASTLRTTQKRMVKLSDLMSGSTQ